jgi:hypothetical protein
MARGTSTVSQRASSGWPPRALEWRRRELDQSARLDEAPEAVRVRLHFVIPLRMREHLRESHTQLEERLL